MSERCLKIIRSLLRHAKDLSTSLATTTNGAEKKKRRAASLNPHCDACLISIEMKRNEMKFMKACLDSRASGR